MRAGLRKVKSDRLIKKYYLACTINQFLAINSFEEIVNNVSWLDMASSIHNIELTKELIKELRLDNMYNDRGLYRLKQEVNNE